MCKLFCTYLCHAKLNVVSRFVDVFADIELHKFSHVTTGDEKVQEQGKYWR